MTGVDTAVRLLTKEGRVKRSLVVPFLAFGDAPAGAFFLPKLESDITRVEVEGYPAIAVH